LKSKEHIVQDVYIIDGKRTAMGRLLGGLSQVKAPELGSAVIGHLIKEHKLETDAVEAVYMGQVLQGGVGQSPARQVAMGAGLAKSTPCSTINKVCGSGMEAIIQGAREIQSKESQLVVSGGMENMSLAPFLIPNMRSGQKFGKTQIIDSMEGDGLTDAYAHHAMGNCAEETVQKFNITREEQDDYAIESYKRSQSSVEAGIFAKEIVPVEIKTRKGVISFEKDEGPFDTDFDKIKKLRSVFIKDGTITAANASTINDGAAAVLLAGEKYKQNAQFKILGWSRFAHDPTHFASAPVESIKRVLDKTNLKLDEIDLFEVNEAFAVVPLLAVKELGIATDKMNILGGAISLGHPIGCSGARIIVTLMNALNQRGLNRGLASICIGGGEALSLIIERV
jgi:acetyl-CoA C-acetyltransferase